MSPERLDRTIDFILRSQARAEVRHERAEARHERAEARQDKLDRRVDSIMKIVKQGMRLFVKLKDENAEARIRQRKLDKTVSEMAAQQKEFRSQVGRSLAELAQAQKTTEQTLQAFINSVRGSRNGH